MIASPHYDRQSLLPELHRAADDMGEWALLYTQTRALGLIDNNLHRLAQEEAMRKQVIEESVQHFCGYSFCHGPDACGCRIDTSGMEPGEFAEMACAHEEESDEKKERFYSWMASYIFVVLSAVVGEQLYAAVGTGDWLAWTAAILGGPSLVLIIFAVAMWSLIRVRD